MTAPEIAEQTLLEHVDENSPPAFMVHALDDETCHFTESTLYADALIHHGVEVELHLFPHGGHGFVAGTATADHKIVGVVDNPGLKTFLVSQDLPAQDESPHVEVAQQR